MSLLGHRLRTARLEMGWTLQEAAGLVGLDWRSIQRWETDSVAPDKQRVMGMAYLYGRPLSWFYDNEDSYRSPVYSDALSRKFLSLASVLREGARSQGVSLDRLFGVGPVEDDVPGGIPDFDDFPGFPVAAAAGAGTEVPDESRAGHIRLDPGWLRSHALSPDLCDVIFVRGDSMDPTLPDGCSILVDRGSRELREGGIFVLRTADGLVVKRTVLRDGGWILSGDNPDWVPVPLSEGDRVVGEVRWSGRVI